ncbi:MAG TPA: hypothetical protein DEO88_11620 [Syntrophobacteraceae bacterium]|nr:hypothetical protein [Syntrophobacteraceae bacterium]
MTQNYRQIRNSHLEGAYSKPLEELETSIPAVREGDSFHFEAFGEKCLLSREEVLLSGTPANGPEGLLIAMYANTTRNAPIRFRPIKAFKEFPDSMPYQGAFHINAERPLIQHVPRIQLHQQGIIARFSGHPNPDSTSGDFSFTLFPLPRVPLYYVFHLPDEEFPAAATCLFAANALDFMALAGLADVAEYTAKRMIALIPGKTG